MKIKMILDLVVIQVYIRNPFRSMHWRIIVERRDVTFVWEDCMFLHYLKKRRFMPIQFVESEVQQETNRVITISCNCLIPSNHFSLHL